MSFQAVRAVFETPVIEALGALPTPVPCYADNQAYTVPDAGEEYATVNFQFGTTTTPTLSGNLERLRGSLVVECYTAKNTGPARAQEMITPVMKALNNMGSCTGYEKYGAIGWVGDMTGPAFFALDSAPFYMVRLSVSVTASYRGENPFNLKTTDVQLVDPAAFPGQPNLPDTSGLTTLNDANEWFYAALTQNADATSALVSVLDGGTY